MHRLLTIGASLWTISVAVAIGIRTAPVTAENASSSMSRSVQTATNPVLTEEELATVGESLLNKVCSTSCHELDKIEQMRRTSRDWHDQVTAMSLKGAKATEAQFVTIQKYLARYYGFVAINTAPADEIATVMGFSSKDAQAIVTYRTAHGPFADVEALAKVPGIDKTKIDEQPDALRFK